MTALADPGGRQPFLGGELDGIAASSTPSALSSLLLLLWRGVVI